jgi:hypothetical protein
MARNKGGRPTTYSEEIANVICERLADGESLKAICEDKGMPSKSAVFNWLAAHSEFVDKYARAREAQADSLFDDILTIADDGRNDWMEKKNADGEAIGWQENGEAIRRSQLRIEARKWMAGKLKPKKYGDKLDLNVSGSLQTTPEDQIDARIAQLLGKAGIGGAAGGEGEKKADE